MKSGNVLPSRIRSGIARHVLHRVSTCGMRFRVVGDEKKRATEVMEEACREVTIR